MDERRPGEDAIGRSGGARTLSGRAARCVYPLVTARALGRPFTYEVADGVGKGAVVSVRLGRRSPRGVVVELGVAAPAGVEIARAGPRRRRIPASLVDLALWLADYYGSTPARALALVAPMQARAGAASAPSARRSASALAGEPEPER